MATDGGLRRFAGFSLIELLVVVAILLVIVTIAVPQYTKSLMAARETKAVANIRAIHTAQTQYYSSYGRFASSLQELGPPSGAVPGPAAAELIDSEFATGQKGDYRFSLQNTVDGYRVTATPVIYKTSGTKTYYSDQNLVIHEHRGPEPASVSDPLVGQAAPQ